MLGVARRLQDWWNPNSDWGSELRAAAKRTGRRFSTTTWYWLVVSPIWWEWGELDGWTLTERLLIESLWTRPGSLSAQPNAQEIVEALEAYWEAATRAS